MQCNKYWICWKFSANFTTDKNMNSNLITIDIITCGKGCMCVPLCCIVLSPSVVSVCSSMDCSPPGSSVHGDSPGKNTGVGYHALFQGIFSTWGLNSGLPHCGWILYCLSHQGNPWVLDCAASSFSRGSFWPRSWPGVSWIAGGFFTSWTNREALCVPLARVI